MEPAINIDRFAGDTGREIAAKPDSGLADILDGGIASQRYMRGELALPRSESGDCAGGKRTNRPGADGVNANAFRPKIVGEIAYTGFQCSFSDTHDIVVGGNLARAMV